MLAREGNGADSEEVRQADTGEPLLVSGASETAHP